MTRTLNWLLFLLSLVSCPLAGLADDSETPLSPLLQQSEVQFQGPSKPGQVQRKLSALTDGQTNRPVELKLDAGVAIDLTYQLPRISTCQQLRVFANTKPLNKKQLPRIEVLASTLSGQAGFQSIRSVEMKSTANEQRFELPPTAAEWLIVRIISPLESIVLQIAEVDVQGKPGLPQTRYAFKEAPAKAFQVLKEVQKSVSIEISEAETSLFKDAADGKLDDWSFAEAALLSCGIEEAKKRQQYLAQIDRITEQARNAIKDAQTPYEKGEALLKWLHANVMDGGYEKHQTDLSVILDTGKFNCVSSATLYNIIGQRLGLDLRAIEVPDHAFSIQYEGTKHADVETTNAGGFNPARDPRILERFTQETGFSYIPDRHADKRREVTNIGLMALTYFNHGVTHGEKGEHAIALVDYFRALNLDPEFPSAIQNVLSTLHSWSGKHVDQKKFAEALKIIDIGLRLTPEDKRFLHNQQALWQAWALSEIKNNNREKALDILTQATKVMPKAGFDAMRAYAYIYPGERLVKAKDWQAALELANTGLKTLPEIPQKELRNWRNTVYNRWIISTIDKKQYDISADILEQAMKADPKERDFTRNIGFVTQEWLLATKAKEGLPAAEKLILELATRFETIRDTNQVIETFLGRTALQMISDKQYDEAQALVDRHKTQLAKDTFQGLHREIFEKQASRFRKENKWEETIAVYTEGLKKLPKDRQLTNNLIATWNNWAGIYRKVDDWSAAAEVYLKALQSGIDNREMGNRVGFCVQELALHTWKKNGAEAAEAELAAWIKKKPELESIQTAAAIYVQSIVREYHRDKQPAEALNTANRCRKLLKAKDHEHFVRVVCDQWSQTHRMKAEWDQAIAVYTLGLKSLPKDKHLTRNAVITWDERAKQFIKKKQWGEAIKVYDRALEQFPNQSTLRNNLKYCLQQASK